MDRFRQDQARFAPSAAQIHFLKADSFLNGEFWDCLYRARGFGSLIPGLVRLTVIYHNFIHRGSRKDTPVEAAGVMVAGPDKIRTLIQNAALAAA